jgi:hypothetical protein
VGEADVEICSGGSGSRLARGVSLVSLILFAAIPVPPVRRRAANHDRGRRREVQALFTLLAILAGAAVPVQFAVDSELRGTVGGTITAAAIPFLVGTLVLGAVVLLVREGVPAPSDCAEAS